MLISLRKRASYFYVLFVIIIVSFVFWVPGGIDDGQGNVVLARVGDMEISLMEFWTRYDNAERSVRDQKGKSLEDAEREQLKIDVLAGLMHEVALIQVAQIEGIVVTNKEVEEMIKAEPAFQREGRFDPEYFDYVLRQNRMDRKFYISARRAELLKNKVLSLADSVVELAPDEEAAIATVGEENLAMIKAQLLTSKADAVRLSYSEGLKNSFPSTYNLELVRNR